MPNFEKGTYYLISWGTYVLDIQFIDSFFRLKIICVKYWDWKLKSDQTSNQMLTGLTHRVLVLKAIF